MKTKYIRPIIFFAIAALLLWWLNHRRERHAAQVSNVIGISQSNSQSAPPPQPPANARPGAPAVTAVSEPTPESNPAAWIDRRRKQIEEEVQKGLNEWRTPIEFYGKVVDENTNGVSGVGIDFSCNDTSSAGTSHYQTTSDANGFFSLNNVQGKLLVVRLSKQGYYTSKRDNDSFEYGDRYSRFVPDAANPVVFHLRKKGNGESLIKTDFPVGIGQIAQLHHDGTPIELDLTKGAQVPAGNGQLKLEFWRDLSDKNARIFDWKLQLSALGGGLIETDDEFAFQAPEGGYQPSIVIDMPATNQNWRGEVHAKYYIHLPNGKYGRIDFYLLSRNGVFTVQSAVNPSGSRNLETAN